MNGVFFVGFFEDDGIFVEDGFSLEDIVVIINYFFYIVVDNVIYIIYIVNVSKC